MDEIKAQKLILKGAISELTQEQQDSFHDKKERVESIVREGDGGSKAAGLFAITLLALEMTEED